MLVEDDNNLREIYEARLLAEGYEIISAKDGEEALALATKEKPDLIISDVMMPKISGFDMLDILRSTPGIEQTKVVMMTALSQAEDKARADKLGADKYLVKSQVTLEDVAKVADELLNGPRKSETADVPQTELTDENNAPSLQTDNETSLEPATQPAPVEQQDVPMANAPPEETSAPAPSSVPAQAPEPTTTPAPEANQEPQTSQEPAPQPAQQSPPPQPTATMPNVTPDTPPVVAEPAPQPAPTQNAPTDTSTPKANDPVNLMPNEPAQSTEDEKDSVNAQIDDFVQNQLKNEEPAPVEAPTQQPTPTPEDPSESQLDATDGNSTASLPSAEPTQSIEVKDAPSEPESSNQQQTSNTSENLVDAAATNVIDNKVADNDQPQPAPPKTPDPNSTTPSSATGGQRVIQPLPSTEDSSKPNIHQLAQEEDKTHPSAGPPPTTSVVSPNGQTVTPSSPNNQPDTTQPGNVIQPGGNSDNQDVNQIAL